MVQAFSFLCPNYEHSSTRSHVLRPTVPSSHSVVQYTAIHILYINTISFNIISIPLFLKSLTIFLSSPTLQFFLSFSFSYSYTLQKPTAKKHHQALIVPLLPFPKNSFFSFGNTVQYSSQYFGVPFKTYFCLPTFNVFCCGRKPGFLIFSSTFSVHSFGMVLLTWPCINSLYSS